MAKQFIYHIDPITNVYLGSSPLETDPIDNKPMLPSFSTQTKPPTTSANKVAQWDGTAWILVDDYRGYTGFDSAGVEQKITTIGIVPDPAWTTLPPFVLSDAISAKKAEIRDLFNQSQLLPIIDINGISWSGGYTSALKIDGAKRLAELAGQTSVVVFDSKNMPYTLTILEAVTVILAIGADYQAKFATKQSLMNTVDALPATATQADIDAIVVAF